MEQSFPIKIPDFQADFEDIHLFVKDFEIDRLLGMGSEEFNAMIPHTIIGEDNLHASGFVGKKDLVGKIYATFPSEMADPIMAIQIELFIRVRPIAISQSADVLCKTIHFMYQWMEKWVDKNKITDINNQPFKMPPFLYSRGHFLKHFPEEAL